MKSPVTFSPPEKDAEYWAIRLDGGSLDASEQTELDAWLAGDPRHDGSLLRAQATLSYLDRGRALHAQDNVPTQALKTRRTFLMKAGLIATGGGLAAAASVAGGVFLLRPRGETITTRVGEVRQVALADGSTAVVNTDSQVTVRFEGRERRIALAGGEAWFQVAHDKSRPFIVEAGDVRVRAVGTAFSVRRHNGSAEVLVTEGVVETWRTGDGQQPVRIAAGDRATVTQGAGGIVTKPDPAKISRALSWRRGELALAGENVDYAVAEMNRYNAKQIVVDSPRLGREPLVGYFRTNEPEKFTSAVAVLINARVIDDGARIHLVSLD